jgi:hypothetical protein
MKKHPLSPVLFVWLCRHLVDGFASALAPLLAFFSHPTTLAAPAAYPASAYLTTPKWEAVYLFATQQQVCYTVYGWYSHEAVEKTLRLY